MLDAQQAATASPRPDPAVLRDAILKTLEKMKGEETVTIDLSEKSEVTSYMIISSGASTTKVGAMAQEVRLALKELGAEILSIDGTGNKDWVLIDANDCVVHLFRPPVRAFYNLERLWAPDLALERESVSQHPLDVEPDEHLAAEDLIDEA